MSRRYESETRQRQKTATRLGIISAAARLLATPSPAVQIGDVARAAGVSAATVYRHFPTKDALLDAVYDRWMEGARKVLADMPNDRDAMLDRLGDLWAAQAADDQLEQAMSIYSPAGRSVRRRRLARRKAAASDLVADIPIRDETTRRALEAALLLLTSTTAHRHLREHWGVSTTDAASIAAWAVRAVIRGAG